MITGDSDDNDDEFEMPVWHRLRRFYVGGLKVSITEGKIIHGA